MDETFSFAGWVETPRAAIACLPHHPSSRTIAVRSAASRIAASAWLTGMATFRTVFAVSSCQDMLIM